MDYSTLPNDPDHPAGTSPWQSSPQPGSPPSPPTMKRSQYNDSTEGHTEDYNSDHDDTTDDRFQQNQGRASQPNHPENGASLDPGQRYPSSEQGSPELRHQTQQPQQQAQQQQRSGGPNRYRGTTRPTQRQNLPQYKLQAKITGLERTGRKDPVLRFDVHVSHRSSSQLQHY